MPRLTVRNLPEGLFRALRIRADQHGRSVEAEVRAILEATVGPHAGVKLGSLLSEIGRQAELSDPEFSVFECMRERAPAGGRTRSQPHR
jgi:plasmid stability protein